MNDADLAARALGDYRQFTFAGANGDNVFGYVVKPPNFKRDQTYPVALVIHGGPEGSMANEWHWRWNAQTFAGGGYGVVMIDFHGSTGYGQAFTDAIRGDWGGKPLEDLKLGLAAALKQNPWLDGEDACALGGSYGGFMINWIAGQWPDRFKCLVTHDGIFDNRSMYYATEELWFPEWEMGGPEYENPAAYAKFNPLDYVSKWKTPTLVIHGQLDYRIPYEPRSRRVHGPAAPRRTERAPVLPRREPLGAQALEQHSVVRHRARLAEPLDRALTASARRRAPRRAPLAPRGPLRLPGPARQRGSRRRASRCARGRSGRECPRSAQIARNPPPRRGSDSRSPRGRTATRRPAA